MGSSCCSWLSLSVWYSFSNFFSFLVGTWKHHKSCWHQSFNFHRPKAAWLNPSPAHHSALLLRSDIHLHSFGFVLKALFGLLILWSVGLFAKAVITLCRYPSFLPSPWDTKWFITRAATNNYLIIDESAKKTSRSYISSLNQSKTQTLLIYYLKKYIEKQQTIICNHY